MSVPEPSLLTLPYDIRFLIYQHLFPAGRQIYLQASSSTKTPKSITPGVPTNLISTSRQLHSEASEYLYNSYLFNLVGWKQDCLATYEGFLTVLEKYAREEVKVELFSNGRHSATMAISMYVGDGELGGIVGRRGRGLRVKIEDIRRELEMQVQRSMLPSAMKKYGMRLFLLVVAVLAAILEWWIAQSMQDEQSRAAS